MINAFEEDIKAVHSLLRDVNQRILEVNIRFDKTEKRLKKLEEK